MSHPALSIFIATLCAGTTPALHDNHGSPIAYDTQRKAQLEILNDLQERLRQFIAGKRDSEDAITVDDFILRST